MAGLSDVLAGPVLDVAPRLLGARLSHAGVSVRLTEVEAYAGPDDPGSHAYRSRTARNAVMFGPPGRLYTYFSYGMHVCANVVCGPEGTASAVLLRAGEVVEGVELARERRPAAAGRDRDLARGPARLCQALGIGLQHGERPRHGPVTLVLARPGDARRRPGTSSPAVVRTGPRVGLRGAPERPWRFWIAGEPSVSAYRPAAPRRPLTRPAGARWARRDPDFALRRHVLLTFFLSRRAAPTGVKAPTTVVAARRDTGADGSELTGGVRAGKFLQVAPPLGPRGSGTVCV